jgi:hypothetical protein
MMLTTRRNGYGCYRGAKSVDKKKSEFVQSDENHKNRIAESFFSRTAVLKVRCELEIYVFDE